MGDPSPHSADPRQAGRRPTDSRGYRAALRPLADHGTEVTR